MKPLAILLIAMSLAPVTSRTNSDAATRRGARAFAAKDYAAAAQHFGDAAPLRPSPQSAFNLGTAQVAAGDLASGRRTLNDAMRDASLRADALYNRGTAALVGGEFDAAVSDLSASLRATPGNVAAKRNLEIALRRQEAARRMAAGGERQKGNQQQQQKGGQPQGQQPAPKPGDVDPQQILRSVQQQELEELSRMKRPRNEPRVGW